MEERKVPHDRALMEYFTGEESERKGRDQSLEIGVAHKKREEVGGSNFYEGT